MIRHSSSLFLSLVVHVFLIFVIYLGYKLYFPKEMPKHTAEKRVKIQLCNIQVATTTPEKPQEIKKIIPKPIQKSKPVKPKPIKKPIPKPKPKPKKIVQKKLPKVEKVKIIEETIPEVKKKELTPVKPLEKKQDLLPEEIIYKEETPKIVQESTQEKSARLEREYLNEHIQKIKKLLSENLYYPRSARKRGIVGTVIVKFKLSTNAQAHSIEVIESNSPILTRAAITTIEDLSSKFPSPQEELLLHVPINYNLSR